MLKKGLSVVVMCLMVLLAVPICTTAQQESPRSQNPIRIPPCGSDCKPAPLDDTYKSVNQAAYKSYTTVTYPTVGTNIAITRTNLQTLFNHAQAIGNNTFALSQQQTFVQNITAESATPPAALVTALQAAMKKYSGVTPSRNAISQWMETMGKSTALPALVAVYEQGGMLAVENEVISNYETFTTSLQSRNLMYASYHQPRARLLPVLKNVDPFDVVVKGLYLVGLLLAFLSALGCENCDGGAAAAGLIAGLSDFMSALDPGAFGGQTQQDWLNQGTGCDPCD